MTNMIRLRTCQRELLETKLAYQWVEEQLQREKLAYWRAAHRARIAEAKVAELRAELEQQAIQHSIDVAQVRHASHP